MNHWKKHKRELKHHLQKQGFLHETISEHASEQNKEVKSTSMHT